MLAQIVAWPADGARLRLTLDQSRLCERRVDGGPPDAPLDNAARSAAGSCTAGSRDISSRRDSTLAVAFALSLRGSRSVSYSSRSFRHADGDDAAFEELDEIGADERTRFEKCEPMRGGKRVDELSDRRTAVDLAEELCTDRIEREGAMRAQGERAREEADERSMAQRDRHERRDRRIGGARSRGGVAHGDRVQLELRPTAARECGFRLTSKQPHRGRAGCTSAGGIVRRG